MLFCHGVRGSVSGGGRCWQGCHRRIWSRRGGGIDVVSSDEFGNDALELRGGTVHAALDLALGHEGEPALDLIESGRACWSEVDVETRALSARRPVRTAPRAWIGKLPNEPGNTRLFPKRINTSPRARADKCGNGPKKSSFHQGEPPLSPFIGQDHGSLTTGDKYDQKPANAVCRIISQLIHIR